MAKEKNVDHDLDRIKPYTKYKTRVQKKIKNTKLLNADTELD